MMAKACVRLVALAATALLAACATDADTLGDSSDIVMSTLMKAAQASQGSYDYGAAASFYANLYQRNPENREALLGYVRNLRYVGSPERAIGALRGALENTPEDGELLAELGKAELAAGRPEQAVETLTAAAEFAPDDWRIHSALGIAYDRLEAYEEAMSSYEEALRLSPDNPTVLNNLALSRALAGDLDGGVAALKRAETLARPGAILQIRQNLALLHALKGDFREAERLTKSDLPEKIAEHNLEYYQVLATGVLIHGNTEGPGEPAPPLQYPLQRE